MGPSLLRPLKAVLVALAIAAVTGTGIGLASAAGEPGDVPLPSQLAMSAPRGGEQGVFNATARGAFALGVPEGEPFQVVEYGRGDGGEVLDAYARSTDADLVGWGGLTFWRAGFPRFDSQEPARDPPGWYPDGGLDFLRAGTPEFIASGGSFSMSKDFSFQPAVVLPPQQGTTEFNLTMWSFDGLPSCLLVNPLQGRSTPSDMPIAWSPCDLLQVVQLDEDWIFHAMPGVLISGYETVRLEASNESTTVAFYVNRTLPVPLRTSVQDSEGEVSFDLVRFQAGDDDAKVPVPPGPTPGIEHADRQPWGLDDTGSRLNFPPSAAYRKAMEDPTFSGLRDYVATHPDAYAFIVSCNSYENADGSGAVHSCQFVLSDGPSAYVLSVQKSVRQPPSIALPELLVTYAYTENTADPGAYPNPEEVQRSVPTLRALEERYVEFSQDPMVNHLTVITNVFDEPAWVNVGNGTVGMTLAPVPDPTNPTVKYIEFEISSNSASFGQGGRAHSYAAYTFGDDSEVEIGQAAPPPPLPEQDSEARPLGATILAVWSAPSSPEAAGVGLVSVLVGILYWLWPSIKSGSFLGLFSRISGQDLLEHPVRAQLLQIVQAEPGVHFQDLVRRSGLPNGTAVHHLGKLSKGGLISVRALGRYTCYFPGVSPDRAALAIAPILRSEGARKVYEAIQGRPGLSGLELAGLVGLQPSTVNYHVQRLVESGLVLSARDGHSVRLSPAAA